MLILAGSPARWTVPWTAALLLFSACGGSDAVGSLPPPPPPSSGGITVSDIIVSPNSVALPPGGQQQFIAEARFSDGTTGSVPMSWSATGGVVSNGGLYSAGTLTGIFSVIAADSVSGKADTSAVKINSVAVPGPYATIAQRDWSTYADKSALAGKIGVEGGLQALAPALPVTDFYDLVADSLFGKVVRYLGDPSLNLDATNLTRPGRTATHQIGLAHWGSAPPNASWWTPPPALSTSSGAVWFPTDVWLRQFIKFSLNWTNTSARCGQGGPSYKVMFLRFFSSPARHEFVIDDPRGVEHSVGTTGFAATDTPLPITNVLSMDKQYGGSGWPYPDFWPAVSAPGPYPAAPYGSGSNWGGGDGEWREIILHHKTLAERGEFTMYWRKYTVAGVINPQPWQITGRLMIGSAGSVWRGLSNYQMGVNRNRCYDEAMHIDWGPYEVVDGSQYPNPWGLPGGD